MPHRLSTPPTAHVINSDWGLDSYVLGTVSFDGHHTGVRIADLLKAITQSYSVSDELILAHIHDQAANAQLAGRLLEGNATWTSEVCAAHCLQNCIRSAFTAVPDLEESPGCLSQASRTLQA